MLKGGADEVYEPRFTFQGFRYVAVEGWPGEPTLDSLTGIVVHSDMPVTGRFTTSSPLLNQLQHNIQWGQKGNFLDVPTDCPQRDERLGWTGDAQVFSRTAAFNMDVAGFFTKWLADLAADQSREGSVPLVMPDVLSPEGRVLRGLGGMGRCRDDHALDDVPAYGDTRLLERQYPSMVAWVEFKRARPETSSSGTTGILRRLARLRDDPSDYPGATTGKDLIATAFFAHSTDLVQRAAAVLGRGRGGGYAALLPKIKQAFVKEFVTAAGASARTRRPPTCSRSSSTSCRRRCGRRRRAPGAEVTRAHLTTGFVGTPYLCHVLRGSAHWRGLSAPHPERYPSWLYPVTQGATTIWERWDGQNPDGTFQDAA